MMGTGPGRSRVGVYTEYLDRSMSFDELIAERKKQLQRISTIRGRDILVFAADLNKGSVPISINYSDIIPITDQLANLTGSKLDLVLETPGGSGEVAENIVRMLRDRYADISVIVPGWAKSAGTIIAMAGDEIAMGPESALGPIDAQLFWQGKAFSAEALLEGVERIKNEAQSTGSLNKAYIPILQGISPGELENARNALNFAKVLVKDWLARYKFKNWTTHSSTGNAVTESERRGRAEEIATALCNHSRWLSHGRSIRIDDLRGMKLQITDYSENAELADAIRRYHTLLQMTFESNVYKVFETPVSQVYRFAVPQAPPVPQAGKPGSAVAELDCPKCKTHFKIQVNFGEDQPIKAGNQPFPKGNLFKCLKCGAETDLSDLRRQIEAQTKQKVIV